jgi:Sec-independent protein translocase protein TatA
MFGFQELLIIGSVLVIFFGIRRLPDAVKSVKKSVKAFQGGLKGEEESRAVRDVTPKPSVTKGSPKDPESE